ncbi:MAG: hypothetical protein JWM34_1381 [Ilumatobacteraceae bacterium]|nr:hypothetical protein [Ilumatobacteraceae bacterium]
MEPSTGIAAEKYVVISTLRRSGDSVPSPVWIAPLADGRAGFVTDGDSGKVKRIRNNSAITLQACSMRGTVKPGAPIVRGTAVIVEGSEYSTVRQAINTKYGLVARIMGATTAITKRLGRKDTSVGIVITLEP